MSPLVSLVSISKSYTHEPVFSDLSVVVTDQEKLALIGPNGSGKSTLLKIIAGIESADDGQVVSRRGLKVAYVAQQENFLASDTVYEAAHKVLLENNCDDQARLAQALSVCGIISQDEKIAQLSGGWKKRLAIACALAQEPDLLLLDEPTNHLDIEAVAWLEKLLIETNVPWVAISHDRYFIEACADKVIEIHRRYPNGYLAVDGGYSDFIEAKAERLMQLQRAEASLKEKVRREVAWLRQGARARTTKAKYRVAKTHELVEQLQTLPKSQGRADIEFSSSDKASKQLLKVEDISFSYDKNPIISNLSLLLSAGKKISIVGANGSGKTTLLRVLLGELSVSKGKIQRAKNLVVAHFEQNRKGIDPTLTLRESLTDSGNSVVFQGRELHIHSWINKFGLRQDQLDTRVASLSGGEQARLVLARLMLVPADVLVFDEPTNDLDIDTLEVLEESLLGFEGGLILVTHDRYLIDRVSHEILGLAGEGTHIFCASYAQWLESRSSSPKGKAISTTTKKVSSHQERKELSKIPEQIDRAEKKLSDLQEQLSKAQMSADAVQIQDLCEKLAKQQSEIDKLFSRWQELEQN